MGAEKFLRTFLRSFNPRQYPEIITEHTTRESFKYFLTLLIIMSLFAGLIALPQLTEKPKQFQKEFSKITDVNLILEATTKETADFGFLVIDLSDNVLNLEGRGILVTNDKIEYKLFLRKKVIRYNSFQDFAGKPETLVKIATYLVIFIAPYLLILMFLYHFLKYFLIIFFISSFIIVVIRTSQGFIDGKPSFKAGFFASFFLMIELPLQVLVDSWIFNTLVPFFVFFMFYMTTLFFLKPDRPFRPNLKFTEHIEKVEEVVEEPEEEVKEEPKEKKEETKKENFDDIFSGTHLEGKRYLYE
jgi:hypothetical protein